MKKIIITVIEANKPSGEAVKRLNKTAYKLAAAKSKDNNKKTA